MRYLLGVDVATTAVKAILIDRDGRIVETASSSLRLSRPKRLWSEQAPDDWWKAAITSIQAVLRAIDPDELACIGLTGQMHGLVVLDKAGEVVRPAILWNDQRTQLECDEIRKRLGTERLVELTGNDVSTGFTAPKILWVRQHEPTVYSRLAHILLPKDYVRFRLSGEFATDLADASGTFLLDVAHRRWSDEMLEALQLNASWLPQVLEGTEVACRVTREASSLTGIPEGTPIVAGGGDQAAQAVGVGAVSPGVTALTLGTSGVVFAPSGSYRFNREGRLHAFCHAIPGVWHLMGVMLSAAGALQWYRETLAPGTEYRALLAEAETVAPGCDGLVFLPYLTGERCPHADPTARAAFVGLTVRHSRGHLTRAVLEGVAFGLLDNLNLIRAEGIKPGAIRASGGGVMSGLWLRILADVLRTRIVTVNAVEGAAFGAAILAAVGVGFYRTAEEACLEVVRETSVTEPGEASGDYDAYYSSYRSLYPILAPAFASLSALS